MFEFFYLFFNDTGFFVGTLIILGFIVLGVLAVTE